MFESWAFWRCVCVLLGLGMGIQSVRAELPETFDLRNFDGVSYVTPVKDQQGGTCWAHGTMAAMEGNLYLTRTWYDLGEPGLPNLAEYHLDWWNGFNQFNNDDLDPPYGAGLTVHEGGDYRVATAYLSRGEGAVRDMDGQSFDEPPLRSSPSYHYFYPRDVEWFTIGDNLENIDTVKAMIMTHGVLATAFCSNDWFMQNYIHYQPPSSSQLPNHAVGIIGWNDNKETQAPEGPGAWLVKNSWGSSWGLGGYFWISYYDKYCCREMYMGAVSFQNVIRSDYQRIYHHDYHGWRATKEDASEAFNAFTAVEPGILQAVSFFTSADDVDFTATIYAGFEEDALVNPLVECAGTIDYRGLHTIDLPSQITLLPGQPFYIHVSFSNGGHAYDCTSDVPVLLGASYRTVVESSASRGESFYRDGDTWRDLTEFDASANFCIKGLTIAPTEGDCDNNGLVDLEEIGADPSLDCNENLILDVCELGGWTDCDDDGVMDLCEIYEGTSIDCQPNGIPDECEDDCNGNLIADECDIEDGTSPDCNADGVPDECSGDCNDNGVWDACDIFDGTSSDCDQDAVPDDCQDTSADCNDNGIWDACDLYAGTSEDCNANSQPDECDISSGMSTDCDENGVPDDCDMLAVSGVIEQLPGEDSSYAQDFADVGYATASIKSWDDFSLSRLTNLESGEAFFTPVDWSGYGAVGFLVEIATGPGGAEAGEEVIFTTIGEGEFGTGIVRWEFNGLSLPAGTWWVSVQTMGGFGPHGFAAWLRAEPGDINGSEHYVHNPGGYWGVGSQPVPGSMMYPSSADLAFRLIGPTNHDCNDNGVYDVCDVVSGASPDCDGDLRPDECGGDCEEDGVWDVCQIFDGTSPDCNTNMIPDACDIAEGTSGDCNENGVPDECDIATAYSGDCNENGVPDECEPQDDCNLNGVQDICDLAIGTSQDCNQNGIPDECDIAIGFSDDCNANGIPDVCDLTYGSSSDCNQNETPDECDITAGTSTDYDADDVPDDCQDCNENDIPDACEVPTGCEVGDCLSADSCGQSEDCDGDGVPDECHPDRCAPAPDPIEIESAAPMSPTSLMVVAVEAADPSGPVEYEFHCLSGVGGTSRSWDVDRTFLTENLNVNSIYSYRVRARDGATEPNVGEWSESVSLATMAVTPGAPILTVLADGSVKLDVVPEDESGLTNPSWTKFAVECVGAVPPDPDWYMGGVGRFVDAAGQPVDAALWQGDSAWGVVTLQELRPCTEYTFAVKAKNLRSVETEHGGSAGITTEGHACDLTGDGVVDFFDLERFRDVRGTMAADVDYLPCADGDGDGEITSEDYALWLDCYRAFVGDPAAPPPMVPLSPGPVTPEDEIVPSGGKKGPVSRLKRSGHARTER